MNMVCFLYQNLKEQFALIFFNNIVKLGLLRQVCGEKFLP
jgi:3-isopropylmalate dehydratase small subunit